MRSVIAALPLLALTACGGASGPQSIGSIAPPAGGTSGGTGGGVSGGTGSPTPTPTSGPANLLDVSTATTFNAIGSFQSLDVTETGNYAVSGPVLYQGNAATVRAPSGTVSYDPRDGIFTVAFSDSKAGMSTGTMRFQDPGHRTEIGVVAGSVWGVPILSDFNYLEVVGPSARPRDAASGDLGRADSVTFFYQRPGSQTKYVSLAGYVRNAFDRTSDPVVFKAGTTSNFQRGALVFGQDTVRSQIPITGTGTYTGGLLASMVVNTTIDSNNRMPNYFQWITGSSSITLDFSRQTMSMLLTGTVQTATYGGQDVPLNQLTIPGGATFEAKGSGTINLTGTGGFTGSFGGTDASGAANYARFVNGGTTTTVNTTSVAQGTSVAGASSIDGTFFGPNAVNVGGNLRIVGGVPGQRVDILGAFTGAKQP
ncbi:hypothetical protein M9980_06675 [Sphingomonas donggukensis]|uniref:Transferrin-binding protein B C-lobe/N-lobe beta barrel domain-containing protein n=1 Tax=Sphingomonas donggukensis TaxID=2949093 RepID=A0ABY4U2U2_9SPHN|nr:hypothetical protein [Sphingomonas donggukensis]URW76873.1 hypothetical protein M9980_06675 [Sphingomonas donggukensis]